MNRRRIQKSKRQSGIALILLLVILIMAGAFAFFRSAGIGTGRAAQEAKLAATLARAKEALIARAVTDANRPGSLPCPDLITNSGGLGNIPGDGKADDNDTDPRDFFVCPRYVGWLPWVTLDLPELTDDTGTHLWYVLTPELRDDDIAQPINSDRAFTLRLDGNADSVAALVIAARAPIASQARPSNNPADYLDGENGNSDDGVYVSGPPAASFNDMVVAVTRQELMAAVEKRVANEIKACLEEHAASAANTEHAYPWPAPLSNSTFRGTAGSLFGQVPATQPGAGAESLLRKSTATLTSARTALAGASTASDQMAALVAFSDAATYARALYDSLYGVASALALVAGNTRTAFATLAGHIDTAAANNRISRTERTNLRAEAVAVHTGLTALQNALTDSGIDPFPGEVLAQNLVLQQELATATATRNTANFTALMNRATVLVDLFSRSVTPNPDIGAALNAALVSANSAQSAAASAAATPADTALVTAAINGAGSLVAATVTLHDTIQPTVNLSAGEIQLVTLQVSAALADFAAQPSAEGAARISARLGELRALLNRLTSDSPSILVLRNNALVAIDSALVVANAANDFVLIQTTTNTALAPAYDLARTVAGSRINLPANEISAQADRTAALLTAFNARPDAETAAALARVLTAQQTLVNTLVTNSSLVVAARSATLVSTAGALATAKAAADFAAIDAQTNLAVANARALSLAMANNGDNVTKESLAVAASQYLAAQAAFNTVTPPTQAAMVPYVRAVQDPAVDIAYWAQVTARNATDIATQARKAPAATSDNAASAYYAADQLTSGIAGSSGTQALLQAYINAPTNAARQAAATAALNSTLAQADALLTSAGALDSMLDSGSAEALPTVWFGSACAFLQPASGDTSWWTANNWANTTFYQISDRVRLASGKLQVNGAGSYRVVTLSAGRAIGTQPQTPLLRKKVGDFLEGINADPQVEPAKSSRDDDAQNPVPTFTNAQVSPAFNDRLAY